MQNLIANFMFFIQIYQTTYVMVLMFISLVFTINAANKKEDSCVTFAPKFKFMCNILILVTCLVYNILLAKNEHTVFTYFTTPSNLLNHLILPIMFVLDWVLFYEHGKTKWYYPLLCTILPLVYVVYILVRAVIVGSSYSGTIYPYFFLDLSTLGWGGFIGWVSILFVIFVVLGYIIYVCDNFVKFKNAIKQKRNAKN